VVPVEQADATITAYRVTFVFNIEFRDLRHNVVL